MTDIACVAVGNRSMESDHHESLRDCHADDDDEPEELDGADGLGRKLKGKRWNIPKNALQSLEQVFKSDKFPTVETRKNLAGDLNVTPRQVQVWFQNKRQRSVKPSTGMDAARPGEPGFLSTSVSATAPSVLARLGERLVLL